MWPLSEDLKTGEIIIGGLIVLAVIVGICSFFYIAGENHIQNKWDAEKIAQKDAVAADKSQKQEKADSLDEAGFKQLQDQMVENQKLKDELDDERAKNSAYKCPIPDTGVQIYNKRVRAVPR